MFETIQWISVNDRLPKQGESAMINGCYLGINSGHVQPVRFYWKNQEWKESSSREYTLTSQITHWAEYPKGESNCRCGGK